MTVGASIFLIAVGAIMRFAVADNIEDVDLSVVGVILIVCGVIGLVIGLIQMAAARRPGGPRPPY